MAKKAAKKGKGKATPTTETALITVSSGAMSKDVGPVVIASLAQTYAQEQKAHDMLQGVQAKRYDLLANTTSAIVKAAINDENVDLSKAFDPDKKTAQALNEQLQIALGVKEYQDVKGKKRLVYTKEVSKFFPTAKDKKDDPKTQQKATLRSNFIHLLKKCSQAATAIVDNKIDHSIDKESGTLLLSGSTVQKVFGADEVLLNEKQTISFNGDGSKEPVQLKERPSFQALANIAAQDHGAVLKKRADGRTGPAVDSETAIVSLSATMVKAIGKMSKPTDAQRKALESVRSAIEQVLD